MSTGTVNFPEDKVNQSISDQSNHDSDSVNHHPSRFQVAPALTEPDYEARPLSINGTRKVTGFNQLSVDCSNSYHDTCGVKSFRNYTREVLPRLEYYRNASSIHGHISRPTLDELHGALEDNEGDERKGEENGTTINVSSNVKFGWVIGVFIRCLAGIWGIMLYLRLSWIVAQAGGGLSMLIIILASSITLITAVSVSAICTNGEVRGGGTYYLISRSLGPEFGGSIGVIFFIANAVAVAMYITGFAEPLNSLLKLNGISLFENDLDNIRLIGVITVVIFLVIVFFGTSWEAKVQIFMIVILIASIVDFIIGSFVPPTRFERDRGYVGWNRTLFQTNFQPDFRNGEDFFTLFAIFFPAVTGILAGANISGDLKDPSRAIPVGTISAIFVTTLSYLGFALIFTGTSLREVLSNNGTTVIIDGKKQGLFHNFNMVGLMALYGPLIYGGIFCASLSSGLGSFVSAPKVFQALCRDKLFPYIEYFGKGSVRNNEPYRGYLLTFVIALSCCLIGDLNAIAPIISNFFLAAYCLINYSCFHASFSKSLGFRPSFKYYNMWVSLFGSIVCAIIMFIINWQTALLTFAIEIILYLIVMQRRPVDANWGSSTQAQTFRSALLAAHKLNQVPEHIKTYRPQILLLSGSTTSRPALVDFAYSIVKGYGMLTCGHVMEAKLAQKLRESISQKNIEWLRCRRVKGFYSLVDNESLLSGGKALIKASGVGKLRPNIVFLGYKTDWQICDNSSLLHYFNLIHEGLDHHMGICILRFKAGFDYSHYGSMTKIFESMEDKSHNAFFNLSFTSLDIAASVQEPADYCNTPIDSADIPLTKLRSTTSLNVQMEKNSINMDSHSDLNKKITQDPSTEILTNADIFRIKQKKSTIDVWWLYDDGGLTILVPYILSTRKQWSGCKLRIFALANKRDDLTTDHRNMVALLNKFRISHSDVIVIPNVQNSPKEESRKRFERLVEKWRKKEESKSDDNSGISGESCESINNELFISDSDYQGLKNKSNRHMRLRELLEEHSMDASLIVMTLPMPRLGSCSAPLFMAWTETLTADMPPFLLIRGAQQSVLTFYS